MEKENKQFIVVVVIVLAAVVFIDLENSKLSGKLVDRRNIVDETIDFDARSATDDPDAAFVQQQPPVLDPTSVAPLQPLPEERVCTITDHTKEIIKRIPQNEYFKAQLKLDDRQRSLFIIETVDNIQAPQKSMRYIYNLGQDQIFSDDDRIHSLYTDAYPSTDIYFAHQITQDPITGNEKLFWVMQQPGKPDELWSCDLPQCLGKQKEMVLRNSHFVRIAPSLAQSRIFFIIAYSQNQEILMSCSRNAQAQDWCGLNDEQKYKTYTDPFTTALTIVSDRGMVLYESQTNNFFFFEMKTEKTMQLPAGSNVYYIGNFLNDALLLTRAYKTTNNQVVRELIIFELITQKVIVLDALPNDVEPKLIDTYKGNIYTIYGRGLGWGGNHYKKDVNRQERKILDANQMNIGEAAQLANGKIIGWGPRGGSEPKIASFDCTP